LIDADRIAACGKSHHRPQEVFASKYPVAKPTPQRILGNIQPIANLIPISTIRITSAVGSVLIRVKRPMPFN
jgi:hypothetical protein